LWSIPVCQCDERSEEFLLMKRVTQLSETSLPTKDDAKLRIIVLVGGVRLSVSVLMYRTSSVSCSRSRERWASLRGWH
jgi:hypothetical protein